MLRYNLNILNNKNCKGNENIIRKNIKHMNEIEIKYIKNIIKGLNELKITKHAEEKQLLNKKEIQETILNKKYQIIDYNFNLISHEERVLVRTKKTYNIQDNDGIIQECYIKIVISITTNTIITCWGNIATEENKKNKTLLNKYVPGFDIISKRIKIG